MNQVERHTLADRMLGYYRWAASYHEEVKAISPERPSEEEMVLFEALVRLSDKKGPETRVLELGCGWCESAPKLLAMLDGARFSAVEASADAVEVARARNPGFDIRVGDISHLPFSDNSFDLAFFNYVLEHTCEPNVVLNEAVRVVRPGGLVGMIVPVGDLPWLMPQSLRHRSGDYSFLLTHSLGRWWHFLRLRYSHSYFKFPLVAEPIVLTNRADPFLPDDDQVYEGSTLEIEKYLRSANCQVVFSIGRDISSYIRNGRRPAVNLLRSLAFWGLRASLLRWDRRAYTSTVTIVARKH